LQIVCPLSITCYASDAVQCWIEFPHQWQWQLYMTLVAVTVFVIPALIITACYAVIVFTIWSKSKLLTPTARKARHMKSESSLHH
jgi:neuropeptide S receptor 1